MIEITSTHFSSTIQVRSTFTLPVRSAFRLPLRSDFTLPVWNAFTLLVWSAVTLPVRSTVTYQYEVTLHFKYEVPSHFQCSGNVPGSLSKPCKREGGAGAEGAILPYATYCHMSVTYCHCHILPYVGHLQLISTLKIGADCCQLCQYKLTKPNLT